MRVPIVVVLASLATACASTGASPRPFPTPAAPVRTTPESTPPVSLSQDAYAISGTALALRGTPYKNGGNDPGGFDCSGFVWYVFHQHELRLPRTVTEQFQTGTPVDATGLRAGDLVFFDTINAAPPNMATHVGISIGGEQFVHAPSTAGQVRVERLGSTYWAPRFLGARRVQ
jgi:cell wall-associated NlpC family hydrolase